MPSTQQTSYKSYDPVPPYDLEDIESQSSAPAPALPTPPSSSQQEPSETNILDPATTNNRKPGDLTQRECCHYAFMYVATSIIGVVLMTWIIAYYSYLGSKARGRD